MKWTPKINVKGKPEANIWVCGRWSISKIFGGLENAYVYELRYEDTSPVGARFGTFPTGKAARDEAERWGE